MATQVKTEIPRAVYFALEDAVSRMGRKATMANTAKSLGEMLKLVEDGVLVRNTKDDGNFAQFAIDSFRLARVLKEAQQTLSDPTPFPERGEK